MGNWSCDMCDGLCCTSPPHLDGDKEAFRALKLGAQVVAVKIESDPDRFNVAIVKRDDRCPFLVKGECAIYDKRFASCKDFKCRALDMKASDVLCKNMGEMVDTMTMLTMRPVNSFPVRPDPVDELFVEIMDIPVVSSAEIKALVSATDMNTVMELMACTID